MPLLPFTKFDPNAYFPDGVDPDKERLRAGFRELQGQTGMLPPAWALYEPGTVLVNSDTNQGPAPVEDGTKPVLFGGRPVGWFRPDVVRVGTGFSLTDRAHTGRMLLKDDPDGATLTVEANVDERQGIKNHFTASLLRWPGSGDLQVTSSFLTNVHPAGHDRVVSAATLIVSVTLGGWWIIGDTAP